MLMHLSTTPYAVAASAAAATARQKLAALIDQGRTRAAQVIESVMTHQPEDRLVRGAAMSFEPNCSVARLGNSTWGGNGAVMKKPQGS